MRWPMYATLASGAVECDFCGLRYAKTMVGSETCCGVCAAGRVERIKARVRALAKRALTEAPRVPVDLNPVEVP